MMRRFITALIACAACLPSWCFAQTNTWPTKSVRIVVPAPAGSSLDIVARLLSEKLSDAWKQPVIVDNKPGAGGVIGVDAAAKSTDGHTLALGFNGPLAFAPALYKKVPYDVVKDLAPIVLTTVQPNVLVVNANLPVKDVREFIAYAKANNNIFYASISNAMQALKRNIFRTTARRPLRLLSRQATRRPCWPWPRASCRRCKRARCASSR
jgi:tripartite-type tricarboxylate transporter receptor subunit TctC